MVCLWHMVEVFRLSLIMSRKFGSPRQKHTGAFKIPLGLTAEEKKDLVAFMNAFNGDPVAVKCPKMPE